MELEQAIKHIIDGNAMLFLGAGFSYDAKNSLDKKMGDARELSREMCREMNIKENDNLSLVSNHYVKKNKDNVLRLIERLQDYFTCRSYEEYQGVIASLPWMRVYTTNYDDVFEKAVREVNRETTYKTRTLNDSTKNITRENAIIHLNGYIRTLTEDKLENEFKLTTKSYMVDDFLNSQWCGLFKLDVANADAIIFIGTSFEYDLNLQRILYADKELREKVIFIDKKVNENEIDELQDSRKLDFGEVHRINVKGFADEIKRIRKMYTKNSQKFKFKSFQHINEENYDYEIPTVRSKWDLLVTGKIDKNILSSNYENDDYIFQRNLIDDINNAFEYNNNNVVVIHSNLGQGKTCLIEKYIQSIKSKAEVFKFKDIFPSLGKEIVEISKCKGIKYIVVENYTYYLELIKKFKPIINEEFRFIFTARTFLNESVYYKLPRILGVNADKICRLSLNGMKEGEDEKLVKLLDSSTIWAQYNSDKEEDKLRIISEECNNNLSDVLLKIVKSESVSREINKLYNKICENKVKKSLLLGVIVNSTASLDLELKDIINVIGVNSITLNIESDENLNQLINLKNSCIEAQSSILGHYIIEQNDLTKDILEVMRLMVINANKMKFGNKNKTIITQLNSISNINQVITDKSKRVRKQIVEYFDSLKEFEFYKDSPFFWLQYAMACLDAEEFDRAEKYLKNAYNKSEKKNFYFDTYQIDTQYARYLMENTIYRQQGSENVFEILRKAHDILLTTLSKSKGQSVYIFKQVPTYYKFIKKFSKEFEKNEKNEILDLCDEMEKKISQYSDKNDNKDIESSLSYASKALDRCKREMLLTVAS